MYSREEMNEMIERDTRIIETILKEAEDYERDVTALKPDPAVPGKTRPGGTGANGGGNGPAAGA